MVEVVVVVVVPVCLTAYLYELK